MRKLLIVLFLALSMASCAPSGEAETEDGMDGMKFHHDDERHVGCWTYRTAISCLPDSEYKSPR